MLAMIAIVILCLGILFLLPRWELSLEKKKAEDEDPKTKLRVKKLWTIAQESMKERKPMRAEKALLMILKMDEKNAAAYNRLGILYAKSQKFEEAIECFEIAQSLDPNPSSLHNAGLIYLETGAFEKAKMAFEQALKAEDGVAARYIALSKAEEKLGNNKAAVEALEKAYALDGNLATLRQVLAIFEATGDEAAAAEVMVRIEAKVAENNKKIQAKSKTGARAKTLAFKRKRI